MKQFVTIDTDKELVELAFSGNFTPITMNPKRLEKILRRYVMNEAKKLNAKLVKPKFGIVNDDDLKDK